MARALTIEQLNELVGKRFGHLVVLEYSHKEYTGKEIRKMRLKAIILKSPLAFFSI